MTPKYTKKYIKKGYCFGVFWEEKKDRKTIGYSKWFATSELADEFIKEKQDEIQTKEK